MSSEEELFTLIFTTLRDGFALRSVTDIEFAQAYQPTQQGQPTGPLVSVYSLGAHRYGSSRRVDNYDPEEHAFVHSEKQKWTEEFQIQATATRPQRSPRDICQVASAIMQSDFAMQRFQAAGVGILRVTDMPNPVYSSDKDRHEFAPHFTLTVTYDRVDEYKEPVAESIEPRIHRV